MAKKRRATARRKRRLHSKKWDRCVREVKRSRSAVNPYAVCTRSVKRSRNPRPLIALYAQGPRTPVLKYVGWIKFAKRGVPVRFATKRQALSVAGELKRQFPVLRKFKLWAV